MRNVVHLLDVKDLGAVSKIIVAAGYWAAGAVLGLKRGAYRGQAKE